MASPQESVTTVNGRRCTRSRARTAATSTSISTPAAAPTVVAPTEPTASTIAEQAPQTLPNTASPPASQPPPPPPPPPPPAPAPSTPSSSVEASVVVPVPTSQAAVSSAIGTGNAVLISLATSSPLAILEPPPAPAPAPAPAQSTSSAAPQSNEPAAAPTQIVATPTFPPARIAPTSSDTIETAVISSSLSSSTPPAALPTVTESAGVRDPTSVAAIPEIAPLFTSSQLPSITTSIAELLPQVSSAAIGNPSRAPVGIIAPEQGSHSGSDGHTPEEHSSHSGNDPNIGGIVGGVVGGFVALALLSALLFFCLRKRRSRESEWDEKSEEPSGFKARLKAIPAGFGVFFAKLRNEKSGPMDNPYQRHVPRSSVGSVYSTTSSGRGRSISEPQGQGAAGGDFIRRMSSRKSERNVLRKKTSSVSSLTPFAGITEERTGTSNIARDPFADPAPDTPRNLRISNPDTIEEQPQGPTPPQPAATPRVVRDPFASLIDEIDGAPNWLRDSNMTANSVSNHQRTQSAASALKSHPPSSVYSSNPFADPYPIPPIPTQPQPQPPTSTYSAFPATRDSNYTFFGEPGPSRPGTTTFTIGLPSRPGTSTFTAGFPTGGLPTDRSRMDRQSDPFDLDRPEVLSFKGIMNQMRDSIARQTTVRSRRTSSVGNWFGRDNSPGPGPLNGQSVRR